jgi:predicted RNA-binding Zn-ribbon protein involved in translation (DUF1610 family)
MSANTKALRATCPNCGDHARVRTRKTVTRTIDELYYQCPAISCGMTWKSQLSLVHVISPGASMRPELRLPMAPFEAFSPRRVLPGTILAVAGGAAEVTFGPARPANDDPGTAPPVPANDPAPADDRTEAG